MERGKVKIYDLYEMLGIPVHETRLGMYGSKLVVACKDFTNEYGTLDYLKNHPEDVIGVEAEYPTTLDEGMEI